MINKKNISLLILMAIFIIGGYYITIERKAEDRLSQNNIVKENSEDKEVSSQQKQILEIAVGKEAPNFTLKNLEGMEVSLEDYRGKIVLVNFWATWCVYCDIEMPDLQKIDTENEDVVVLAVDVGEDKETVEKYINENGYDFEVVLDENGAVARMYLVGGYPASYFIDKEGILIGSVPGMMTYEQMNKVLEDIRQK